MKGLAVDWGSKFRLGDCKESAPSRGSLAATYRGLWDSAPVNATVAGLDRIELFSGGRGWGAANFCLTAHSKVHYRVLFIPNTPYHRMGIIKFMEMIGMTSIIILCIYVCLLTVIW